jgi:redox-sensitive bicupin YhaK (pirin superfamily)
MTAGRGIVHSERTPPSARAAGGSIHGLQLWVGLPREHEETAPAFHHHPGATLPRFEEPGVEVRVRVGEAFGMRSPVRTYAPMFYLGAEFPAGSRLRLPPEHAERGVYAADAALTIDGLRLEPQQLAVLAPGSEVEIAAAVPARAILFGGAPLDGERHLWWNFVSSSRERIDRAKADWVEKRFAMVPDDPEFIPLPTDR